MACTIRVAHEQREYPNTPRGHGAVRVSEMLVVVIDDRDNITPVVAKGHYYYTNFQKIKARQNWRNQVFNKGFRKRSTD